MFSYLRICLSEALANQKLERQQEPMLMENTEQVLQYANYGLEDSALRASYLYHAIEISKVIQGCRHVVDLGCGPATQLCLVASLNPHIQFSGCDLSQSMLDVAQSTVQNLKLANISFFKDDITKLSTIADQSVDGVISTVVLHHLPTASDLELFFKSVQRILKPNGAVYLLDFSLLKSRKSVDFFVALNGAQPQLFVKDYLYSLLAAFPLTTYQALSKEYLPHCKVHSTFAVPFMTVTRTKGHNLGSETMNKIETEKRVLSARNQNLMKDLSFFFGLTEFFHRRN